MKKIQYDEKWDCLYFAMFFFFLNKLMKIASKSITHLIVNTNQLLKQMYNLCNFKSQAKKKRSKYIIIIFDHYFKILV